MSYQLVPENDRINLMPKSLKFPAIYLRFEDMVYEFAHELLGEMYKGGYWEFYENAETFFFAPGFDGEDKEYHVYSPNGSEGYLSRIEAGMVVTSFALSHIAFYAYEKGISVAKLTQMYQGLLSLFETCENASTMFALID